MLKINIVVLLGFMAFMTANFWLSLYMQNVLDYSPLKVAVHLLPQAIGGIAVNIVAGLVLHKVNNKLLTGIGSLSYLTSVLLLATMKKDSSYWAHIFPALLFSVIGADLHFNVANVRFPHPLSLIITPLTTPSQMYIMSSLPSGQQSLGGGIFNTVTKVWTAVGLGISASIYNAESTGTAALQTSIRPYTMVFWFCVASAGFGCCFVPFLTIGTQGSSAVNSSVVSLADLSEREKEKEPVVGAADGEGLRVKE